MSAEGEQRELPLERPPARPAQIRVLVLARSYPSAMFPTMGLWTERPTTLLADRCDIRVVAPVPYCPPLPERGPLRHYTGFRRLPAEDGVNGVRVYRPRYAAGPGTTFYAVEPVTWLRALVPLVDRLRASFLFDLVHAHFVYPEGVVGARLARRYDVPLVISEHAPWEPWLRRFGVARQAIPAARYASSLLPVSTSVRDSMVPYLGEVANRADVVPPGVDGEAFPLGEGPRERRILYVGFLNRNKGVDVLLEAMRLLKLSGDDVRLLVVGGSHYRKTRAQEGRIRQLPQRLAIADRVEFAGILPPARVAALMRGSAVVVLPSRAESFGAVLVEALASGTPVVATKCGGPQDIVTDDVGLLVPSDDPRALADALATILARDTYVPSLLREYALAWFGLESVVDRIHAHYSEVISERVAA